MYRRFWGLRCTGTTCVQKLFLFC
uniref:Uncharacterized protein n=1 Tax=Arundo donax TaxID=35708 RepID=A0A0A9EQ17_ARUDO